VSGRGLLEPFAGLERRPVRYKTVYGSVSTRPQPGGAPGGRTL